MNTEFDIVIVGGGLVGASLAIALDGAGWRVALVEAVASKANYQPSYDERNLALARASVQALTLLNVWQSVAIRATSITHIHVTRRGDFGAVRLVAAEHGVADFGAVLPARELGNGLLGRLDACVNLTRFCPAQVCGVTANTPAESLSVRVRDAAGEHGLSTRLLVGADGADSWVRSALGIGALTQDYAQTGFVTTLTPERPLDGCAYERFTDTGPVALLPLTERRAGLVLTVPTTEAPAVATLDDNQFVDFVHERFGYRLGRFSRPGKRVSYPLRGVSAVAFTTSRAVLVGNAAQTVHPIGAQGFNLGLRDALTLAELLIEAARADSDPGSMELLTCYAARREPDRAAVMSFSDGLVRFMGSDFLPLRMLRSLGLLTLERLFPLKHRLVQQGMGFRGAVPLLARGVRP